MFPRRSFHRSLVLLFLLLALAGREAFAVSTALHPVKTAAALTTLAFSWDNPGGNYVAAISTDSKFLVTEASGTIFASATTNYIGLDQNTTYYFRVKKQAETDAAYIINTATSSTLAAQPLGTYSIPAFFSAVSSFTAVAKIGWDPDNNPDWTRYEVSFSTDSGFFPEHISVAPNQLVDVGGLAANTTYYFRVRARGLDGTPTAYTPPAGISTATLAVGLEGLDEEVFETSATISWTPVSSTTQAMDSEGYRLHVSTNQNDLVTPTTVYWTTGDHNASSVDLGPLAANTEYNYKIGALNWGGNSNLREIRSFATLAPQPQNPALMSVSSFSATVGWTALPGGTAEGYELEASSTGFDGSGAVLYTAGYDLSQSTLTVTGLDANTTYYFRTSSLNLAPYYDQNYSARLSSITLTMPPTANIPTLIAGMYGITAYINATLPGTLQSNSCEGYLLEGSSTAFDGRGIVYSSATAAPFPVSLALSGLTPNVTYSLRLATLNWDSMPSYSQLNAVTTITPPPPAGPRLAALWQSSATITFSATAGGQSYMIEASSTAFDGTGVLYSSATADVNVTTLTITGLDMNTAYYFHAGASYSGVTAYTNATPYEQQTLPNTVTLAAPEFPGVFYSSATLAWTPLPVSPPKATADSYRLEASTSPDFTLVVVSSSSAGVSADHLTLYGLQPNTSYYFRAASVNLEGNASYAVAPATSTLANPPTPLPFGLTPFTMTLNWQVNSNPPDTLYYAELNSAPDFTGAMESSGTYISSVTFSGLSPNTTYYTRVTAINHLNRAAPTVRFADMATAAYDPVFAPFSDIGVSSMTVNWSNGSNPPLVTAYRVQISSSQDAAGDLYGNVLSSVTYNLYAVFAGMVSNASYYMQVSALNYTGMPSPAVPLDSALTLPATPYMLAPEQAFTAGMIDGFTVNWLDNGNSSATVYNVQVSTDPAFSVINSSQSGKGLSCTFKNLLSGTTYWVEARAEGQSGIYSAYAVAGSTQTIFASLLNAVALQDNLITLQASYGLISVHMPAGSIGSSTRMTLTPLYSFPPPVSAVSELSPTGIGLSITYFPQTLVLNAITITLPYRLSDLPLGTDAGKLILAYYDEVHSVWVPLPSVSDVAHRQVIGQTWHLSTFQIMQARTEAGLSNVKIYPDPYRPNSVSDVMHFTNMPPYAKVKIYTFLGELVREIKSDVNGMAHWDGLNAHGKKAASGVYIALIQTTGGKTSKAFKVAVER